LAITVDLSELFPDWNYAEGIIDSRQRVFVSLRNNDGAGIELTMAVDRMFNCLTKIRMAQREVKESEETRK
jgi:hypothetical protein